MQNVSINTPGRDSGDSLSIDGTQKRKLAGDDFNAVTIYKLKLTNSTN